MNWTSVKELRQQVLKLWDKGHLLAAMVDNDTDIFPRRLLLKTPPSKALSEQYAEVRHWIAALQSAKGFRLEMQTVRHPILGENRIPKAIWLDSLEDSVNIIGKQQETKQFAELIALTRRTHPALLPWLKAYPLKALDLADDWSKLLAVIDWLKAHPQPGIYLRQADIAGVDTKFIERHRGVLIALLDLSLPENSFNPAINGVSRFEARYGFLQKPVKVRFRILDKSIRLIPGDSQDITLTKTGFAFLEQDKHFISKIDTVFITENEINFLAFPTVKNSLVIFGAGYGFDALSDTKWLANKQVYYWGDIDTHGFAILNQLRMHLPETKSVLMDKETLLKHLAFWEQENQPESKDLHHLTPIEQQLYNELRDNRIAHHLRLEQEKIGFNWVLQRLESIR